MTTHQASVYLSVYLLVGALLSLPDRVAFAEVYKCKNVEGKTVYQDKPCANQTQQSEVTIRKVDEASIAAAQARLQKQLETQRAREKETQPVVPPTLILPQPGVLYPPVTPQPVPQAPFGTTAPPTMWPPATPLPGAPLQY